MSTRLNDAMERFQSKPSVSESFKAKKLTWTPKQTATYQEDGVIYTVRADEGEDLMDFVSNLDSKPRQKRQYRILLKSIPTLRQIMQEKEMLVLEANTYERKEQPLPLRNHQALTWPWRWN